MLDTVNTTALDTDTTNTTAVTSYYGTAGETAGNIKYDPFAPQPSCCTTRTGRCENHQAAHT